MAAPNPKGSTGYRGRASTPGSNSQHKVGKWNVTAELQKDTGSIMDVDRPSSYAQIGPQSKTGFGKNEDHTKGS
jgi:hypothetical protein